SVGRRRRWPAVSIVLFEDGADASTSERSAGGGRPAASSTAARRQGTRGSVEDEPSRSMGDRTVREGWCKHPLGSPVTRPKKLLLAPPNTLMGLRDRHPAPGH